MVNNELPSDNAVESPESEYETQKRVNNLVDNVWALSINIGASLGDITEEDGRLVRKATSKVFEMDSKFTSGRLEATAVVEQNRFAVETAGPKTLHAYFDAHVERGDTPLHYRFLPITPRQVMLIDDLNRANDLELRPDITPAEFADAERAILELEKAMR